MESLRVERLDHFGLIASVIKELGLIAMSDARLVPEAQEALTPGEAVAGMLLNGLGFANRPLSLTPQVFATPPSLSCFMQTSTQTCATVSSAAARSRRGTPMAGSCG